MFTVRIAAFITDSATASVSRAFSRASSAQPFSFYS